MGVVSAAKLIPPVGPVSSRLAVSRLLVLSSYFPLAVRNTELLLGLSGLHKCSSVRFLVFPDEAKEIAGLWFDSTKGSADTA